MPPSSALFAAALALALFAALPSARASTRQQAAVMQVASEVRYGELAHAQYVRPALPRDRAASARPRVVQAVNDTREAPAGAPAGVERPYAATRAGETQGCDPRNGRSGLEGFFNALLVLGLAALGMRLKA